MKLNVPLDEVEPAILRRSILLILVPALIPIIAISATYYSMRDFVKACWGDNN